MTASEGIEQIALCPLCESDMGLAKLAKLGLCNHELALLNEHIRNRTLKDVLSSGEIALRRIDPESTSMEFQVDKAISKLRETSIQSMKEIRESGREQKQLLIEGFQERMGSMLKEIASQIQNLQVLRGENKMEHLHISSDLNNILQKIGGTGIGKVGETITIQDLKRTAPMDSFDETRATKQGTDIVAKVNENGSMCGTITVSVKYTQTWSSEYMEQIAENMREDGSRFGVLVSKAFPKEALNDKVWMMRSREGNPVILVKPEYAPFAYIGPRQATLVLFETSQLGKPRDDETDEMEKIFKALISWINGEEYQQSMRHIDCAITEANNTKQLMNTLKKQIDNKFDEVLESQDRITTNLTKATGFVRKLRELLNGNSDPSFSRTN